LGRKVIPAVLSSFNTTHPSMNWSLGLIGPRQRNNIVVERELIVVGTSPRGSNLRSPSRGDVVERVGDCACRRERREHEGQTVRGEGQGAVLDPEMQVGRVGVPAVT